MDDRDWIELVDRRFRRQETVLAEQTNVLQTLAAAMRALVDEVRDLRADSRAHTDALMRMIDRMDRLDPGDSAA
jgi:uncharacterized protein (UPF0305 family)